MRVGTATRLVPAMVVWLLLSACTGGRGDARRSGDAATTAATAPVTMPATTTTAAAVVGEAGGPGLGDSYFPDLGNGGYDVDRYRLELEFDVDTGHLLGTATITATAQQALSTFNLDLAGLEVAGVRVDDAPARFDRAGAELTVTPARPLADGADFRVEVVYGGVPRPIRSQLLGGALGWHAADDGAFVMGEPQGAATWFPGNDHPSDKATFSLEMTVPAPFVVAASGVPAGEMQAGDRITYRWEVDRPIPTYAMGLGIGLFEVVEQSGPIPIVNYFDPDVPASSRRIFDRQPEMVAWFSELFGPYPYQRYGALVVDDDQPAAALETQSLATYSRPSLRLGEAVVAHELVHQWFANSVTIDRWQDIWLHEGFATYGQWLWAEQADGPGSLEGEVRRAYDVVSGRAALDQGVPVEEIARELPTIFPPPGDPGPHEVFNTSVYWRGALTLHALRLEVGDDTFFRILRSYADRFADANADTGDFVELASELAGQDLTGLFDRWLYDPIVPALPALGLEPIATPS